MRIEILQQMTDDELIYMRAYLLSYIDSTSALLASYHVEEDIEIAKDNLRKVKQVQEERRHDADNDITTNNKYGFKTKHGKIVESTEQQLYAYWLDHWSEIYSFTDYLQKCKDAATKIIDK